jgi:hypothetical protein
LCSTIIGVGLLSCGCEKASKPEQPKSQSQTPASVANAPATGQLTDYLKTWKDEDADAAAKVLLRTDFKSGKNLLQTTALDISEQEYVALATGDRADRQKQIDQQIGALRQLTRHVLQQGRDAAEAKQFTQAEQCFNAVLELGRYLTGDAKTLALLQVTGRGIKSAALKELVSLYEKTENARKLAAANEELKGR